MPRMPCRLVALLVFTLLVANTLAAAEIVARGITWPFFDAKGRRTHVLRAESGSLRGALQTLTGVELIYFCAEPNERIVQRVQADAATWDAAKETLTGDGRAIVTTDFNRLTGEGFDFALATSLLRFHRAFTLENTEVKLTSDRAVVELATQRTGSSVRVSDVKRCEAQGNLAVSVLPTARKEYLCDQAFSDRAIYDGNTRTIELPQPTRTLKHGSEGRIGHFKFDLPAGAAASK